MKEIIYHVTASTPGRVISIAVDEVLTKDNILGIINKTTGKVLYTPLKYPLLTFGLSAGTLTLTLDSSIPSISVGDHLLIKVYTDGDSSDLVAQFFGLPQALPEYQPTTEAEVKSINDDVMGALYGYGNVTVTIHSLMRTGAETTQDLASVIYVDPEKTWAENGFPTLYDDEGTAIDTTTNPAAGDEVFNYQIQTES